MSSVKRSMPNYAERNPSLLEDDSLARLAKSGSQIVRLSNHLEDAPTALEAKKSEWAEMILNLKASVIEDERLTVPQKAASLVALGIVQPGARKSEIKRLAAELADRFQVVDSLLSQPDSLVMGYDIDDQFLYKTSGSGLKLGVADRD